MDRDRCIREVFIMKYCGKCGKQMNDGDNFCPSCGARQSNGDYISDLKYTDNSSGPSYTYDTSDGARPMYTYDAAVAERQLEDIYSPKPHTDGKEGKAKRKKQKSGRRLIPVLGAAALLMILFLVFFFRCVVGSGSLTKNGAVKAYYDAVYSRDGEALFDATVSNSLLNALEESTGFNKNRIIILMRAQMTAASVNSRYRRVKITDSEKYDKSEIRKAVEEIEDKTGVSVKISQMCRAEVSYEIWNSYYDEWQEGTERLVLYKSGGNWYVMPDNLNF